jgi:hypothetical protein
MCADRRQDRLQPGEDQMSAPGPRRRAPRDAVGGRCCPDCGTVLAADNTARLCSRCHKARRDELRSPPVLKDEFYTTDEFRAAFASRHIGKVFRAYRNHPRWLRIFGKALNQELFGGRLRLSQERVSKIENAPYGKREQNLETLGNYAKILHLPQHMLWFDLPGQSRPVWSWTWSCASRPSAQCGSNWTPQRPDRP